MANTTNFSVRMDSDIKKQCEALYSELGVNLTTAINVFLRQSLRAGGFPFEVRLEQPTGDWVGHRECHIQPDWLLIYHIEDDVLVLTLARTGTHSDLFDK